MLENGSVLLVTQLVFKRSFVALGKWIKLGVFRDTSTQFLVFDLVLGAWDIGKSGVWSLL